MSKHYVIIQDTNESKTVIDPLSCAKVKTTNIKVLRASDKDKYVYFCSDWSKALVFTSEMVASAFLALLIQDVLTHGGDANKFLEATVVGIDE